MKLPCSVVKQPRWKWIKWEGSHLFSCQDFHSPIFKPFFRWEVWFYGEEDVICYAWTALSLEVRFLLSADNFLGRICSFSFVASFLVLPYHSYKNTLCCTLYWTPSTAWPNWKNRIEYNTCPSLQRCIRNGGPL